jgi:hypothetical protein
MMRTQITVRKAHKPVKVSMILMTCLLPPAAKIRMIPLARVPRSKVLMLLPSPRVNPLLELPKLPSILLKFQQPNQDLLSVLLGPLQNLSKLRLVFLKLPSILPRIFKVDRKLPSVSARPPKKPFNLRPLLLNLFKTPRSPPTLPIPTPRHHKELLARPQLRRNYRQMGPKRSILTLHQISLGLEMRVSLLFPGTRLIMSILNGLGGDQNGEEIELQMRASYNF